MLSQDFINRMNKMLGPVESQAFFAASAKESVHGLRLNGLKAAPADFIKDLEPIEWCKNGFYYDASTTSPGKHPYHAAGVYYIQEPSAMAPAERLKAGPGMRVLDLCASPGGKATQIAAFMQGRGLFIANEPHPTRAKILSENIERMGVANCIVTNELPQRLREQFGCAFHCILVDAPCSGEGMFRKDEAACEQWSLENVNLCAARQDEILDEAYEMLLPGGRMVYSTCTFSEEENEGSVARFLQRHPDMSLIEQERLWPHRVKGEGHFLAVLSKAGMEAVLVAPPTYRVEAGFSYKACKELAAFVSEFISPEFEEIYLKNSSFTFFGEELYLLPQEMPSIRGIKVLRTGLHLGTVKKNRFTPAHALSHAIDPSMVKNITSLKADDPRVLAYLNGQTINAEGENGWHLVAVDGYALGWGKLVKGVMKNHYPKGLRIQGV